MILSTSVKRHLIYDYLEKNNGRKENLKEFLRRNGLKKPTYDRFAAEWKFKKDEKISAEEQYRRVWETDEQKDERRRAEILNKLYDRVMEKGDHNAAFRFAQIKGWITEKKEIRVGLNADEVARRNLEAERQLREGGYRVGEVQEKPPVLHDELCPPTGQGESGCDSVETLASLEEDS